jgi:hypothetical protein
MAMDFPTAPNPGQTYTYAGITYTWNGYGWIGGALGSAAVISDAPADGNDYIRVNNTWRMVKQAIIPTVGALSVDIPIPSWAKMAELDFSLFCAAGSNTLSLQVSTDGTTFLAGATDYSYGGPYYVLTQAQNGGTAVTSSSSIFLSTNNDIIDVPIIVKAVANVARGAISQQFAVKSYSETWNAAQGYVTSWYHGAIGTAAGSALRLAVFRVSVNRTFLAGSQIQCRWL